MKQHIFPLICIVSALMVLGCSKKEDEWLDVKYNKGDVVPTTLKEFQALLDNDIQMNSNYCPLGLFSSDNLYYTFANWQTLPVQERNAYIWNKEVFPTNISGDWQLTYAKVFYTNVVLEGVAKITPGTSEQAAYNLVKGSALFFRSFQFYTLVQTFAKPYSATAATDPGIPVRTTSDVNVPSARGTVAGTYDRILSDLKEAESLLPVFTEYKPRPSKTAAQALLARVYLAMGDYPNALEYANRALGNYSTLMNYADRNPNASNPFPNFLTFQPENILNANSTFYTGLRANGIAFVDTIFYSSYSDDDLRKILYYKADPPPSKKVVFKGPYTGVVTLFSGLATNELFYIRAEALVRTGKVTEGIDVLNTILVKRWKTNTFVPFTAGTPSQALALILEHRRKEFPFTAMLRWEDLRRLNQDPATAITLTRKLNGTTYTLPPNDPRYVFPIPKQEQDIYGLADNPR